MTVLSTFNRKPTLPTAFTNLSKICATSGPEFANNRMSSAKRRSTKLLRASPRSKPAFPISVLHCLKAHCRTAVNSRGLKTQPCRTPPVMEKLRLLPHSPMTSPSCSSYAFSNNHTKCSGTPCSRRATHNVGQCTRSNAFDIGGRVSLFIGHFCQILETICKILETICKILGNYLQNSGNYLQNYTNKGKCIGTICKI